ncbi:MAG TPA: pilus assembly protein TadG-related protein [Mycobacteriales bacterium]|jgi:Flp pilus assembly protein TadG|nr:pilus assembly protein TadG-related protein [Mycobacteriales bacterium]
MLNSSGEAHRDDGQITLLVIGYVSIALVLIVAGIDASKVFLAQRALSSAADSAALAAAEGVDTHAVYDGPGIRCGTTLPLDQDKAASLAATAVDDQSDELRRTFSHLTAPQTAVAGGDVEVQLSGEVSVPFGKLLGWLDPKYPDGRVPVTEAAHASSPVAGDGC